MTSFSTLPVLCLLNEEPGHAAVEMVLPNAAISAEVLTKLVERGGEPVQAEAVLLGLRLAVEPFDREQAFRAAELRLSTKSFGLSFADRACLALALSRSAVAFTADRAWGRLPPLCGHVRLIR